MRKKNQVKEIISFLKILGTLYPGQSIPFHIALATSEYNLDTMSNKEFLDALEKYRAEKDMYEESEIDRILRDAMDLDKFLDEEDQD
jgi:hypothetical protein